MGLLRFELGSAWWGGPALGEVVVGKGVDLGIRRRFRQHSGSWSSKTGMVGWSWRNREVILGKSGKGWIAWREMVG